MYKLLLVLFSSVLLGSLSSCGLVAGQIAGQFGMEVDPTEISIAAGSADTVTLKIKPITGISLSSVEVRLIEYPAGVNANIINVITESSWEIQVDSDAASGTYELEAQGISRGINIIPITRSVKFTLVIP